MWTQSWEGSLELASPPMRKTCERATPSGHPEALVPHLVFGQVELQAKARESS